MSIDQASLGRNLNGKFAYFCNPKQPDDFPAGNKRTHSQAP
jgi:hypothetical protein